MVSDLLGIAVSKEKFKRAAKLRDAKDWILRERCVCVLGAMFVCGIIACVLGVIFFVDLRLALVGVDT